MSALSYDEKTNSLPRVIDVVIPAYNEEKSIHLVLNDIDKSLVRNIVVCDNNSGDETAEVARNHGATVVHEPKPGYGRACLKALEYIEGLDEMPDIIVFCDADYSDHVDKMEELVAPIRDRSKDLVIGSRAKGNAEKGSMTPAQIFGNWLATNLIRIIYGYDFSDLGPFRAIRWSALQEIDMEDQDFGWTVEMQVKAAKMKLSCEEVAVDYRKRIGVSKISGTIRGTFLAGHKILWTIFKLL